MIDPRRSHFIVRVAAGEAPMRIAGIEEEIEL